MTVYVFDIDGTICTPTDGDYENAVPLIDRIAQVNTLFDHGHTVIFQTARGMGRYRQNSQKAIDTFYDMTQNQLNDWGVRYHELFLGKPAGDIYIDDKGVVDTIFFADSAEEKEDEIL